LEETVTGIIGGKRNAMRTSIIDDTAAIELYKDGKRDFEIAKECNALRDVVQRWRARKGFFPNRRKPTLQRRNWPQEITA
jgi:hypothetical protein